MRENPRLLEFCRAEFVHLGNYKVIEFSESGEWRRIINVFITGDKKWKFKSIMWSVCLFFNNIIIN